jgi:hypothetical protein
LSIHAADDIEENLENNQSTVAQSSDSKGTYERDDTEPSPFIELVDYWCRELFKVDSILLNLKTGLIFLLRALSCFDLGHENSLKRPME